MCVCVCVWRSRSKARGKPGSASADVPPTNASDCPSSLAMAFSRQIWKNRPYALRLFLGMRYCLENRSAQEDAWYRSLAAIRAVRSSVLQSRQRWVTVATPNNHERGPTELHPFADVLGRNLRSSYDLRNPGQKGVPANASANQPPSSRERYDLGLAEATFENSLHCYTTPRRCVCSRGLDTLYLVLQHRAAWKNPTSSRQGDHPSRLLHADRGSPEWSRPSPARTSVQCAVFSRLTNGTV